MNKHSIGKATIHQNIRKLLKLRKRALKCHELRDLYNAAFGKYYSESGFSARLREMSDMQCDLSTYRYSLEGKS